MKQTQRKHLCEKVGRRHLNYYALVYLSCHQMTAEMLWWASDYLGGMSFEITA